MVDKVRLLKMESSATGGTENDQNYTEIDANEDYVSTKGIAFEGQDNRLLDLDATGELRLTDSAHAGLTIRQVIRGTVLTGLAFANSIAIVAEDTILQALGKLQAQINTMLASVIPASTGTANSAGDSTAVARANHVHDTVLTKFRVTAQTLFSFTSTSHIAITGMTLTPTIAGTFFVDYSCVFVPGSNNTAIQTAVYKNGVLIPESTNDNSGRSGASDTSTGGCEVTANGTTDIIDLRISSSVGSCDVKNRRLRMTRTGPV